MHFSEAFKSAYKDWVGRRSFSTLRRMERTLSPDALFSFLQPFFFARATLNCAFRNRGFSTTRPDFLQVSDTRRAERQQRMDTYSSRLLESFNDRFAEEKWLQRCRIEGLDPLLSARSEGRPVILAVYHFGPFPLLKYWLRARGIPASSLLGGKSESRSPFDCPRRQFCLFPEIPLRFHVDQLRAVDEFLAAGNVLITTLDGLVGRRMDVPFCDGWTFQMATAAARFAIRRQADLMTCSIVDEGRWRFLTKLGRPVPRELLAEKNHWLPAAEYMVQEMMPVLRAYPE